MHPLWISVSVSVFNRITNLNSAAAAIGPYLRLWVCTCSPKFASTVFFRLSASVSDLLGAAANGFLSRFADTWSDDDRLTCL